MNDRALRGNWAQMKDAAREFWPHLTEDDVAAIEGQRGELVRRLKARYEKSYGEIEREVTEFELRDIRAAYAARPSLGITNDR